MASVNFSGGKLHGSGETVAQFRHSERDERMKHEHTNEDIDKTQTSGNWSVCGLSFGELVARYKARIDEVDKTATNKRKDRVTCICAVVPVPEGMTDEQAHSWYRDVWDTFGRHFGKDNMIDACVHVDEKHEYIDPDTKEIRMSRTHAHVYFVPERDGNFDAKRIISRATMQTLNRELDAISRARYGLRFMDGTQAKSRGTVEQLKQRSETEKVRKDAAEAKKVYADLAEKKNALEGEIKALKGILTSAEVEALDGKRTLMGGLKGVNYKEFEALKRTATKVDEMKAERDQALQRAAKAEENAKKAYADANRQLAEKVREVEQDRPSLKMHMENIALRRENEELKEKIKMQRGMIDRLLLALKEHVPAVFEMIQANLKGKRKEKDRDDDVR